MITVKQPKTPVLHAFPDNLFFWKDEQGEEYCLRIAQDDEPMNPRTENENAGILFCRHPRHALGDELEEKTAGAFWAMLIETSMPEQAVTDWVRTNVTDKYREEVSAMSDKDLYHDVIAYIEDDEDIALAQKICDGYVTWLPVWLYEHSGITISCGARTYPFNDRFDSSAIGWITMSKITAFEDLHIPITGEDGEALLTENPDGTHSVRTVEVTAENWEQLAQAQMKQEMETYDQYLTGDVYGYVLYTRPNPADHPEFDWKWKEHTDDMDDWEESDSCYGYFGSNLLTNGILDDADNGNGLREAIESGNYETGRAEAHTVVHYSFLRDKKA